ncbi:MAG: hypothetical protein EXS37_15350 [Opitutus sp.]|nr:hypothetical protein [Opitutus sp.]
MKGWKSSPVVFALTAVGVGLRAAPLPDDPEGRALLQAAQRAVAAYHDGAGSTGSVLRVVYFHPGDREPLRDYAGRLDRVLTDVSDFYRDGLRRFGLATNGLPLERKDRRVVLHVVRGQHPANHYHHESGDETEAEIREAVKGTFDLDREHVLVLYALCRQEPDGRYVFDAPYYGKGGSSQRSGLCHAADCELLDPALLTEKTKKIVYTEHSDPRVVHTLAKFNSWYIGGIAHELAHGLGLDHDAGNPSEDRFGTSLMGAGNLTYRQDRWGGGKPAYLSRGSSLQLVSHPLFTGSDRGRWESVGTGLEDLAFSVEHRALVVAGRVSTAVAPYVVVASVWPWSEKHNHAARTYPVVVSAGSFALTLTGVRPGNYHLQLASLHVNGGTTRRDFRLAFDATGQPDAAALNTAWLVDRAETAVLQRWPDAARVLTATVPPATEAARKLRVLRAVLAPPPPIELASVAADTAFLSDATWTSAEVGWGQPARNHFWLGEDAQNGIFLTLGGTFFDKGLYAHSWSRYAFDLAAKWKSFNATVGIRDGAHLQGSAVFTVRGDGRELYRSTLLRVGTRQDIQVDVVGVKRLELMVAGGEGHPHNSWAIWAEPVVRR